MGDRPIIAWGFGRIAAAPPRRDNKMSDEEVDFSLLLGPEVPTRRFAQGDTIFREGEHGDEFFVVVRGEVEIRSGNRRLETLARTAFSARWR